MELDTKMRLLPLLAVCLTLQACAISSPIVAGDAGAGPSFLFMRDDRLVTFLKVACDSGGYWQTLWTITGETSEKAIAYGVAPEGMKTIISATPLQAQGQICKVEIHSQSKSGKDHVDKSLWVLDPNVQSCQSERSCAKLILESITEATPSIYRPSNWPAA
jgi:hypothetical protein